MKIVKILSIILLFSVHALAEEIKFSEIQKESFMPTAGQSYFMTAISLNSSKSNVKTATATVSDVKVVSNNLNYLLGYGLTNGFTVGIQGSLSSSTTDYSYGPGSTLNGQTATYKSYGLVDPELGLLFRANERVEDKFRVNVFVGFSPKIQTAKYASSSADGNQASGRNALRFQVAVYKEINNFEFFLSLQKQTLGVKNSENASDSSKTTENASEDNYAFNIGLFNQYSDSLSIGGLFNFILNDKSTSTSYTNGSVSSTSNYDTFSGSSISIISKYKLNESSLLKFGIEDVLTYSLSGTSGNTKITANLNSGISLSAGFTQTF